MIRIAWYAHTWIANLVRRTFGHRSILINNFLQPNQSFGREGIDALVRDLADLSGGFYVEVGAHDGVTQSNSLLLENSGQWKGLLIEPIPEIFSELRHNRSSRRNTLLNVALVSSDHEGSDLDLFSAGQMSVATQPTKDIQFPEAHAREGIRAQSRLRGSPLTVVKVPAITLDEALVRAKAPREIDFFSLDVEGFEEQVLRGVDFEKWAFRWLLVETRNLADLKAFLQGRGYAFHSLLGSRDALFKNQDLVRCKNQGQRIVR